MRPPPRTAISSDGRWVAFVSFAPNLVAGQVDDNFALDAFLYDRDTGVTTLVSRSTAGPATAGNGESDLPSISSDGRYIVFRSTATNLVPVTAGADGRWVAFASVARNLVTLDLTRDANNAADIFLFDRDNPATIALVSHSTAGLDFTGSGASILPANSGGGATVRVAFRSSANDLVAGQTDPTTGTDIFLYDSGNPSATALVSHNTAGLTSAANAASDVPAISGDGRYVVFKSLATNLITETGTPPSNVDDVFLYDHLDPATLKLVSHASGSTTTPANGASGGVNPEPAAAISSDRAWVAFASLATNLVAGQNDSGQSPNGEDIFLYDRSCSRHCMQRKRRSGFDASSATSRRHTDSTLAR